MRRVRALYFPVVVLKAFQSDFALASQIPNSNQSKSVPHENYVTELLFVIFISGILGGLLGFSFVMLQARSTNVREVFLPKYPGHQEEGCDTGSSDAHAYLLTGLDNMSLGSLFSTYLTALKTYILSAGRASRTNCTKEEMDHLEQEVLKMEQAGVSALESFKENTQVLLNELEKLKRLLEP